jgi:hypothetical protein
LIGRGATPVDPVALRLSAQAGVLGRAAMEGLAARFPRVADYDERQLARTREDLVFIVRFLAATMLAADNAIFSDFLRWLQNLLVPGGIPRQALTAGLDALRPEVEAVDARAAVLLDLGRQQLRDGRR